MTVKRWPVAMHHLLALLLVCAAVQASAANPTSSAPGPDSPLGNVTGKTDQELTELTALWGQLSPGERRVLLAEVRSRMQLKRQARMESPRVKITRRYGRIVRQADGSVVVQTQSTQRVVPRQGRITFGFGFERRSGSNEPMPAGQRPQSGQADQLKREGQRVNAEGQPHDRAAEPPSQAQ